MKRFVSVYFPHLATDWFTLRKPELKNIPFILSASSHNKKIVTAANLITQKLGICTGMSVADVKAIIPSLQVFDDKPALVPQLLQQSAQWFIRFSPYTASDGIDGVIIDASGCTHLWGGDEFYIVEIIKRLKAKGYHARVAIADTIGAAWAIARFGNGCCVVHKDEHTEAIHHLPPEALRLEPLVTERLHKLGLNKIKDFINMPLTALRRRFGAKILLRIDQALGTVEEFFTPVYPVAPYQERLPSMEPIITLAGIEIALERLLQVLCSRLKKEGKGLREVVFMCYRTDSTVQGIQISTNGASNNIKHLFQLFSLKLSTLEPKDGIELFILEVAKVEKVAVVQESFWNESGSLNDNKISELFDRISAKLGANNIYRCLPDEHYWPERSIKKTTSLNEKKTTEWQTDKPRPIELLSTPDRIDVTAPVPDYPPMNFRYKGKLHTIKNADGPERIEQEWWMEEGAHRDYYAVEDEEGCRYWLFRLGHYTGDKNHQWFIHGFFA